MTRTLYALGWGYVALCGVVFVGSRDMATRIRPSHAVPVTFAGDAGTWFSAMKPFCNAVEVEMQQQYRPAPSGVEGAGYSAACYALAGKIERARQTIDRLGADDRSAAAGIVFAVGHPVADAGDDESAGPIMRLVVEYQPDNYMALYHAGMSEYILGHADLARANLEKFLSIYHAEDGWRANARTVLARLDGP